MGKLENQEIREILEIEVIRRVSRKVKKGGVQAMLVVCTARILVYNCLDAPYLPAGGLPDRYVRYPTGPIGRSFALKILRILKIFK